MQHNQIQYPDIPLQIINRRFFPCGLDKKPRVKAWTTNCISYNETYNFYDKSTLYVGMPTGDGIYVVDIDVKNGASLDDAKNLGFDLETFSVQTRSGGYHLYYSHDPELNLRNTASDLFPGIDTRGNGGYVIVPTEVNGDYRVIRNIPIKPLSEANLQLLKKPEPQQKPSEHKSGKSAGLLNPLARNSSLLALGGMLRTGKKFSSDEIREVLMNINESSAFEAPLPTRELETILSQVENYRESEPEQLETAATDATDLAVTLGIQGEEWLWNNRIPLCEAVLLFAEAGLGKTTIVLSIAKQIFEQSGRRTLLISCEGTVNDTLVKTQAMAMSRGAVSIYHKGSTDFSVNFAKAEDLAALDALLTKEDFSMVVIDSLTAMSSANIDKPEIGVVLQNLQELVCQKHRKALVILHHTNKGEKTNAREKVLGSNIINARVRMSYYLTEEGPTNRLLTCVKSNLTKPEPISFVKDGNDYTFISADSSKKDVIMKIIIDLFKKSETVMIRDLLSAIEENISDFDPEKHAWPYTSKLGLRKEVVDGKKVYRITEKVRVLF